MQYLRGEWLESVAALQRSIALAVSFGGTFGEVLGEQRLAVTETALGRYDRAHERLRRALQVARASDNVMVQWHSIGRILTSLSQNRLDAGDLPRAREYLAEWTAVQQEIGECPGCDVLCYPVAVRIHLGAGDLGAADRACQLAEQMALQFRSQAWTAAARHARGLVETARGRWRAAARHLTEARDLFCNLGQPYDRARSLEALSNLASLAARARQPQPLLDAGALRAEALALYSQLGAAGDQRRLERAQAA